MEYVNDILTDEDSGKNDFERIAGVYNFVHEGHVMFNPEAVEVKDILSDYNYDIMVNGKDDTDNDQIIQNDDENRDNLDKVEGSIANIAVDFEDIKGQGKDSTDLGSEKDTDKVSQNEDPEDSGMETYDENNVEVYENEGYYDPVD